MIMTISEFFKKFPKANLPIHVREQLMDELLEEDIIFKSLHGSDDVHLMDLNSYSDQDLCFEQYHRSFDFSEQIHFEFQDEIISLFNKINIKIEC